MLRTLFWVVVGLFVERYITKRHPGPPLAEWTWQLRRFDLACEKATESMVGFNKAWESLARRWLPELQMYWQEPPPMPDLYQVNKFGLVDAHRSDLVWRVHRYDMQGGVGEFFPHVYETREQAERVARELHRCARDSGSSLNYEVVPRIEKRGC